MGSPGMIQVSVFYRDSELYAGTVGKGLAIRFNDEILFDRPAVILDLMMRLSQNVARNKCRKGEIRAGVIVEREYQGILRTYTSIEAL